METLNPTVEIVMPVCSCCSEVGSLQYKLTARSSLVSFLTLAQSGSGMTMNEITSIVNILTVEDSKFHMKSLLNCCNGNLVTPEMVVFPKEQVSDSQRVLPTALPAPLLTGDILEWY